MFLCERFPVRRWRLSRTPVIWHASTILRRSRLRWRTSLTPTVSLRTRKGIMMKWVLACALAVAWAMLSPASAQPTESVAQFFKGKTIRLMVATSTGGAYGAYAQLFAQFFGKHVPGEPGVITEYRPGAGGVVAA